MRAVVMLSLVAACAPGPSTRSPGREGARPQDQPVASGGPLVVRPGSPPIVLCSYLGSSRGDAEGSGWSRDVSVAVAGPDHLVITTRHADRLGCGTTVTHLEIVGDTCISRDEPPPARPPTCITR